MKLKKIITNVVFIILVIGGLHAQENIVASGGEAIGTGGTVSYTIGEVVCTTATGDGNIIQGVQQPYKISTTVGIKEAYTKLDLSVYPNPTISYLTLKVEDESNLSYQIYDVQGKMIENKKVNNSITQINLEKQPTATYFLNVIQNNQVIKTFKVIKN